MVCVMDPGCRRRGAAIGAALCDERVLSSCSHIMALSTIQKVVMFSGLVLCVSLLLPKTFLSKGKQPEGNSGRFPSSVPQGKPLDPRVGGFPRSHLSEAVSKAKAGGGSNSRKSLVGQIIPIYGFGILVYILYILFKLSSQGKNVKMEPKSVPIANGNLKRKITDYELTQLQDKLKETEEAMEKIISRMGPDHQGCKDGNVSNDEEQQLLERLKEITRVMKEGKVLDGISPEQEAEEAPYMEEWEGYPEETYPVYDPSDSRRRHNTILVDPSLLNQPSAEEIAEQMEFMEDYTRYCTENEAEDGSDEVTTYDHCDVVQLSPAPTPEDETAPEEQSDDEDPAVIAENAGFSSDMASEGEQGPEASPADPAVNGDLLGTISHSLGEESQSLRKRGKKSPDC
ncbi:protein RIC-3 [Hyla sarda]|uniref:protein RIC-3 n=1 Tax=Hyla sarda TaxID=327740 RepID=UPI0024C3933F|nr:protein RIC-3 [Hyla sarda]